MRTPFTISATARETTFFNQATGVERLQPRAMEEATTSTRRASAMTVEQRRARRAELRQFYGMKGDTAGQMGDNAPGASKSDNPLDIDSPLFNADAYYEDLVAKASLSDLMKTASKLATDVGNLQGSRHALVYNHHHQLFAAGDTISRLNSRTPQLLGIMTSLQQSFSEISRLAEEVTVEVPEQVVQGEQWKSEVERLTLMVVAEEPMDKVNEHLEKVKALVEVNNGEEARKALEECQELVNRMEDATT
ncbi:Vps51/Vps67-domain-containing protein [Papiliotrema laurentii]|uniref:Vacuolar protein sorting-associated protein 51 homolog n=1 Tax=Papiliotrema laurentii TaxID=5418 RepID=A0AAD9FND9_PAPLA|nr:Vps51/Vps67-domain-containing protein [Papiliotrema laurentii]